MEKSKKNFNFVCRLCVQYASEADSLLNVFDNIEETSLPDRIKFCTSIEVVKFDGLPSCICYACLEKLNQCFTFKNQCILADVTLKKLAQNKISVTEIGIKFGHDDPKIKSLNDLCQTYGNHAMSKTQDQYVSKCPISGPISLCGVEMSEHNIGGADTENSKGLFKDSEPIKRRYNKVENNRKNIESTNRKNINLCKKNKKFDKKQDSSVLSLISNAENLSDDFTSQSTEAEVKSNGNALFKTDDEVADVYTNKSQVKPLKKVPKPKLLARRKGKSKKVEEPKEKPSSYKCDYCHKVYPSAGGWRYHMHTVHNQNYQPFICDLCGQTFKVKKNLEGHKNSIHFRLKLQLCEVCGRGFASKYALKVHKVWHNDEKNFACDVCGIRFRTRGKLNTHKTTHGGPKKFMCHFCSRDFRWKKDFEVHVRTHTGEKPFKCSHCGKAFSSLTNMKKHEKNDSLKLMMDSRNREALAGGRVDRKDESLDVKTSHFLIINQ